MKLKLDANLGNREAARLWQAGHDVATVYEHSLTSASDQTLIEVCGRERRCLVTLDLDFANPLRFDPRSYAGIAVLRLSGPSTANAFDALITTFIAALSSGSIDGKLWIVELGRVREYAPDAP